MALLLFFAALSFRFFTHQVQPILIRHRCYTCHSLQSNTARFRLQPLPAGGKWTRQQSRRNYESALGLVTPGDPMKSRLLLHPLAREAGGDEFHSGGKFWNSRNDPEFQTLQRWVGTSAR